MAQRTAAASDASLWRHASLDRTGHPR